MFFLCDTFLLTTGDNSTSQLTPCMLVLYIVLYPYFEFQLRKNLQRNIASWGHDAKKTVFLCLLSLHIVNFHQKLLLDLRHLAAAVLFTFLSLTPAALIISSSYLSYQTSAKVPLCFSANHTCANAHTLQEPRSWIWLQWTGTIICQLKISCAIWLPSHFTSQCQVYWGQLLLRDCGIDGHFSSFKIKGVYKGIGQEFDGRFMWF